MSVPDGASIAFGCVCTIAIVPSGIRPDQCDACHSPLAGQEMQRNSPSLRRTMNAACSTGMKPNPDCRNRSQNISRTAGSVVISAAPAVTPPSVHNITAVMITRDRMTR
jgi:hypothetical protein